MAATDERGLPAGDTDFERKRRQIIEYAADVFAERGFVAGTTKDIATRMGLSQPAIYHYVGSKDDLLRELALQVGHDMMTALKRGLDAGSSPQDQLRGFVREFTRAVVDNRVTFTVYYKEFHALPDEMRAELTEREREFVNGVAGVVRDLQGEGFFPQDHSTMVLTEAVIGMVSWVHRWYRPTGPLDADSVSDHFISIFGL